MRSGQNNSNNADQEKIKLREQIEQLYHAIEVDDLATIEALASTIPYSINTPLPKELELSQSELNKKADSTDLKFKQSLCYNRWNPIFHACYCKKYHIALDLLKHSYDKLEHTQKTIILAFLINDIISNNITDLTPFKKFLNYFPNDIKHYENIDIFTGFKNYITQNFTNKDFIINAIQNGLLSIDQYIKLVYEDTSVNSFNFSTMVEVAIALRTNNPRNNSSTDETLNEAKDKLLMTGFFNLIHHRNVNAQIPEALFAAIIGGIIEVDMTSKAVKESEGMSFYMLAVKYFNFTLAKQLIEQCNANKDALDMYHRNIKTIMLNDFCNKLKIILPDEKTYAQIEATIKENYIDINGMSDSGFSLYMTALAHGHFELAERLKDYGCNHELNAEDILKVRQALMQKIHSLLTNKKPKDRSDIVGKIIITAIEKGLITRQSTLILDKKPSTDNGLNFEALIEKYKPEPLALIMQTFDDVEKASRVATKQKQTQTHSISSQPTIAEAQQPMKPQKTANTNEIPARLKYFAAVLSKENLSEELYKTTCDEILRLVGNGDFDINDTCYRAQYNGREYFMSLYSFARANGHEEFADQLKKDRVIKDISENPLDEFKNIYIDNKLHALICEPNPSPNQRRLHIIIKEHNRPFTHLSPPNEQDNGKTIEMICEARNPELYKLVQQAIKLKKSQPPVQTQVPEQAQEQVQTQASEQPQPPVQANVPPPVQPGPIQFGPPQANAPRMMPSMPPKPPLSGSIPPRPPQSGPIPPGPQLRSNGPNTVQMPPFKPMTNLGPNGQPITFGPPVTQPPAQPRESANVPPQVQAQEPEPAHEKPQVEEPVKSFGSVDVSPQAQEPKPVYEEPQAEEPVKSFGSVDISSQAQEPEPVYEEPQAEEPVSSHVPPPVPPQVHEPIQVKDPTHPATSNNARTKRNLAIFAAIALIAASVATALIPPLALVFFGAAVGMIAVAGLGTHIKKGLNTALKPNANISEDQPNTSENISDQTHHLLSSSVNKSQTKSATQQSARSTQEQKDTSFESNRSPLLRNSIHTPSSRQNASATSTQPNGTDLNRDTTKPTNKQ